MSASLIAHRHMLAAEGLQTQLDRQPSSVRVVVASQWGASPAGQHLTSCLVNLLCRQVGIVGRVEVDCASQPLLIWMPSGRSSEFPTCLTQLGGWAVGDEVPVVTEGFVTRPDFIVHVGPPNNNAPEGRFPSLVCVASGWRAWIGSDGHMPLEAIPASSNPIGPFFAASLVAGEIFKRSRGLRRGSHLIRNGYSLWSGTAHPDWGSLEEGPTLSGATLAPFHLIGAGAVGNAVAYLLAAAGLISTYVIAVDDDRYDDTNLNRCLLAGIKDVNHFKVNTLERALRDANIGCFAAPRTLSEYLASNRVGLRADLAREVDELTFARVLSCVDKGASRQHVQGLWPDTLLGGSTLNLIARTNRYAERQNTACLSCHNPPENNGDRFRKLEQELRKRSLDELAAFCRERKISLEEMQAYLAGSAICGGLTEAALRDYASKMPPEFSAGFVSLGAGLLLASSMLREIVFADRAPRRREMTSFNYLNGGLLDASLSVDPGCPHIERHGLIHKSRMPH